MKTIGFIVPALLCAAMASCTVKEDRGPCPCVLDIYLENSGDFTDRLSVSGWSGSSDRLFLDRISPDQYPGMYSKKVDKGFLHVSAYCGNDGMTLKGDKLTIPEGKQCDPVWAYKGGSIDATGESAEDHIVLHKQFAVMHIRVEAAGRENADIIVRARGKANGFDISTLDPCRGDFNCFASLDGDMNHIISVPRQYDDSLELEVFLDGILSRTVRAGVLIANSGYSWDSEDLEDIYLSINLLTPEQASIGVRGWDTEVHTVTL